MWTGPGERRIDMDGPQAPVNSPVKNGARIYRVCGESSASSSREGDRVRGPRAETGEKGGNSCEMWCPLAAATQ